MKNQKKKQIKKQIKLNKLIDEIDVSLMSEEEIYDFIKAMGHTEDTIKEVEEEIKKIKYKG